MIRRFIKVTDGLYRGSAPTPEDVINLHRFFGIRKIVSLDKNVAEKIDKVCKDLSINHIIIPINNTDYEPIAKLVSYDLKSLLLDDGPTFVHCLAGKDRTGMVIAMFQCRYMKMSCEEAIKQAREIGFGIGMEPKTSKLYLQVIKHFCNCDKDSNNADIVDNTREHDDWRGSVLDSADMSSFAPYLDSTRQFPYDITYPSRNDQYPTRENYSEKPGNDKGRGVDVPMVGTFDGDSAMLGGAGPVEPGGGFSDC